MRICSSFIQAVAIVAALLPAGLSAAQDTFISLTPVELADSSVTANSETHTVLAVDAIAVGANVGVGSVTVRALGTGDDSAAVTTARLVWDRNENNEFDEIDIGGGEPLLASSTYDVDNGELTFELANRFLILNDESRRLLVVYDIGDAKGGETFACELTMISGGVKVDGIPVASRTLTIIAGPQPLDPQLRFTSDNMPGDRLVDAGATDQVMAVFGANAVTDDVEIASITVVATGTGLDNVDLVSISLVHDFNNNGTWDPFGIVADQILDTQAFASDDGSVTFVPGRRFVVPVNQSEQFLLLVTVAAGAPGGATFTTTLTAATVPVGQRVFIFGLPIESATLTVDNPTVPLLAFDDSDTPADHSVTPGDDRLQAVLGATAANGSFTIDTVTIQALGSGQDDLDIAAVTLVHDVDADGAFSVADAVLGAGTYSEDNGTLTFNLAGSPLPVAEGTRVQLLVLIALRGSATHGALFAVQLADVTVTGPAGSTISGLPLMGTSLTITNVPSLGSAAGGCSISGTASQMPGLLVLLLIGLVAIRRRI